MVRSLTFGVSFGDAVVDGRTCWDRDWALVKELIKVCSYHCIWGWGNSLAMIRVLNYPISQATDNEVKWGFWTWPLILIYRILNSWLVLYKMQNSNEIVSYTWSQLLHECILDPLPSPLLQKVLPVNSLVVTSMLRERYTTRWFIVLLHEHFIEMLIF